MISTISFANFGTTHKLTKSAGKLAGAEFNLTDLSAIVGFPILGQPTPLPVNGRKADFSLRNEVEDKPVDPADLSLEPNVGPKQKSQTNTDQITLIATGSLNKGSFSVTNPSEKSPIHETQTLPRPADSNKPTSEPKQIDSSKESHLNIFPLTKTGRLPITPVPDVTNTPSVQVSTAAQSISSTTVGKPEPITSVLHPQKAINVEPIVVQCSHENAILTDAVNGKPEPISSVPHQQRPLNIEPILIQSKRDKAILTDEIDQTKVSRSLPDTIERGQGTLLQPLRIQSLPFSVEGNPLFKEVSKIIKADDSLKALTSPKSSAELKAVEPVLQIVLRQDSKEPLITAISEASSPDTLEDASETSLTNIQLSGPKTEKSSEPVLKLTNLKAPVFEQVEPRILELAAIVRNGDESRIIKLRLNPHELGSVDVTLEKSSTGRIDAHIRTETQDAQQILGENLVNLRNSLENAGWTVGELEISCNSFSSNGDEYREDHSHKFGNTENQPAETANLDGNLITEGVLEDRLVNLRA